jgi:hypothetical protein
VTLYKVQNNKIVSILRRKKGEKKGDPFGSPQINLLIYFLAVWNNLSFAAKSTATLSATFILAAASSPH